MQSPILTYGGQGTTKKGVRDTTHAIIFTGKVPIPIKGEKMTKEPVRMSPESPEHHLDRASRINYAKIYTVEHNVKVQFIGTIKGKYQQQVTIDYNNTHPALPDRPDDTSDNDFIQTQGADPRYPQNVSQPPYSTGSMPSAPMKSSYGPVAGWTASPSMQTSPPHTAPGSYAPSNPSYTYGGPSISTKSAYDTYSTSTPQVTYAEHEGNVVRTAEEAAASETPVEAADEEETVAIEPKYDAGDLYD